MVLGQAAFIDMNQGSTLRLAARTKCGSALRMKRSSVRHGDWVVIFDGRKALILQNEGDERYPNLQKRELREHEQVPTRKLGREATGPAAFLAFER
jgi:hypothetical protein